MSMLSEQANKIRKVAKCVYLATDKEVADDIASTLNQAADTIEDLSAKLAAANMERSDRHYGGGYSPNKQPCVVCKNHKCGKPFELRDDNGQKHLFSHISNCPYCGRFLSENYNDDLSKTYPNYGGGWIACEDRLPENFEVVLAFTEEKQIVTVARDGEDWVLYDQAIIKEKVLAWQPLPEPYFP